MSDEFTNQHGYSSTYEANRPYGKTEGLAERLLDHRRILGTDRTLPWVGLGLIEDLAAAAKALGAEPKHIQAEARPQVFAEQALRAAANPKPLVSAPIVEYDL